MNLLIDRLLSRVDSTQAPIVVGLDPLIQNIPAFLKKQALDSHGNTREGAAEALWLFNEALLEGIAAMVPAVKLQMACYEMYGPAGIVAFERTVEKAKGMGLIVIDDSKRNDIGSTAALYAKGHLGDVPLIEGAESRSKAEFLTINPYLGSDGIQPFLKECEFGESGIFILARTSNPSASQYQEAVVGTEFLYQKVARDIQTYGENLIGNHGYSPIGAVVGATWPQEAEVLRTLMPNALWLVPGYGAQGAGADDVMPSFGADGYGALINSSRGIIFAYQNPIYQERYKTPESFVEAAQSAIKDMRDDLLQSLKKAHKLPKHW